jgi:toluene monooxygenase system protein D
MTDINNAHLNNKVGPVMRAGALAKAVAEAAEIDNPGKTIIVDDKVAYLRVSTDGELILRRATIEEMLGKPFRMSELEVDLSSFAGRIDNGDEQIRFYFEKTF